MASILLVDDDQFNRDGLRLFLSGEGYDLIEAGDEETAWQLAQSTTPLPQAAIVDISIPPNPRTPSRPGYSYGISLTRRLKSTYPLLGVVLFSAYEDRGNEVFDMLQSGTLGLAYKLKGSQPASLLEAIHKVLAGHIDIDSEVHANRRGLANEIVKRLTPDEQPWVEQAVANFQFLTPREKEIAHLLAASHNTEGIARALVISTHTTENYITHVYDKLGLNEMARSAPHLRKVVILAKACMIIDLK